MRLKSMLIIAAAFVASAANASASKDWNLAIYCNSVGHGASAEREWVRVEIPSGTYSTIAACDQARQIHMNNHYGARDRWGNEARTQCSQVE